MRIIIDAFGGDLAPLAPLQGAAMAAKEGYDIALVGREQELRDLAKAENISLENITIWDAPDVISMEDEPRSILKAHKDCSMAEGLRRLVTGEGDAFISAGSTGALLMGATFIVKRIKGVSRPALGTLLPTDKQPILLMDCGANADCRPEMLQQFAQMGYLYMTHVVGRENAKIALLNIGTEPTKGGELQKGAFALLSNSDLPFVGNMEARDVTTGDADIVVADGFNGNVLLKSIEGTAGMLMKNIKGIFKTNLITKIAALLVMKQVKGLKAKMDASEYGGAPIIGVTAPVIKVHGNAAAKSFYSAVRQATRMVDTHMVDAIRDAVTAVSTEE